MTLLDAYAANEIERLEIPGQWAWWPAEQGQKLQPMRALDKCPGLREYIDWDPAVARKAQAAQPQHYYDPSNRLDFHHVAPDGKQVVGAIPCRAEAVTECLETLKGTRFWDRPAPPENPIPARIALHPTDRPSPDKARGVYHLIVFPRPIEIAS